MEKDPNRFIGEVYKVLAFIGVSPIKKVELAACQLKDVANILYEQWKDSRLLRVRPIELDIIQ